MSIDDLIDRIRDDKPELIELSHAEWTEVSGRPHASLEVLDGSTLQQGIIGRVLGVPIYLTEARDSLMAWGRRLV